MQVFPSNVEHSVWTFILCIAVVAIAIIVLVDLYEIFFSMAIFFAALATAAAAAIF